MRPATRWKIGPRCFYKCTPRTLKIFFKNSFVFAQIIRTLNSQTFSTERCTSEFFIKWCAFCVTRVTNKMSCFFFFQNTAGTLPERTWKHQVIAFALLTRQVIRPRERKKKTQCIEKSTLMKLHTGIRGVHLCSALFIVNQAKRERFVAWSVTVNDARLSSKREKNRRLASWHGSSGSSAPCTLFYLTGVLL